MKSKMSDQDVLNLLSNLKNSESDYPSDMILPRRDMYIKQAATMAVLTNTGGNGGATTSSSQASTSGTASSGFSIGTVLETALVVALVIEAGVVAYIYRDEISDFINSALSPNVVTVASPPSGSSSGIMPSEEAASETPDGTVTFTDTPLPSETLFPAADNSHSENGGESSVQATTTPNPNDGPGLHLGQTKQPTKDPNENNKDSNNDSNDKDKNKTESNNKDKNNTDSDDK